MKTKCKLLMWLILILGTTNAWATYYLVEDGNYYGGLGLIDYDTLLMTGGTIGGLSLGGYSIAHIEGTDSTGGVSFVTLHSYSTLNLNGGNIGNIEAFHTNVINMTGGNVDSLEMHGPSTAYLFGGQINTMASDQLAIIPNTTLPLDWIHIFCLPGYTYDDNLNLLSGQWGDGTAFNITLQDIGTYPTYDVIEFHIIPEPVTVVLLGLGSIWLKRCHKRRKIM